MATTTVKVSIAPPDLLNSAAKEHQQTVDQYLADLLDRDPWHRRLQAATAATQSAASDDSYQQEVAEWDALSSR